MTGALRGPPPQNKCENCHDAKILRADGSLPGQEQITTNRAVFTDAYAVIPKGVMRDIVTGFLPFCDRTRHWVITRPPSGFADTFSQYIMEKSVRTEDRTVPKQTFARKQYCSRLKDRQRSK